MKNFDNIIDNMIKIHKDPKTQYSPTNMFPSANDLSFAISSKKQYSRPNPAIRNLYAHCFTYLINMGFIVSIVSSIHLWYSGQELVSLMEKL